MLHSLSALDPKVLEPGKAAYVGLEQRAAGACGEGIFVGLTFGCEDGRVIVGDIIPGSQADKDGRIRFGDELVGIETQAGERIEFTVKEPDDFNEVAEVIGSGEPGSKVRLIVRPKGSGEEMIVELTRNGFE